MKTDLFAVADGNLKRFICFRMFFNARFYYPIYALLFLEHGLTWEEFGILNGIWAITIICLEVPSGALADTLGRKKLMVFAAFCMLIEMLTLLLSPMNGGSLVFALFALNRIISGVAEAAVSGADEALAFDSLKDAGREKEWGQVLEKAQKFTSLAFFFAMMTGSAFYDASFINSVLHWGGSTFQFSSQTLVKAPILLTFLSSIVVMVAALGMKENFSKPSGSPMATMRDAFNKTILAGNWVWKTALPFGVLLACMSLDNVIRQFLTIASAYWSAIDLPLATFGLVASGMSLMGVFIPRLARILAERLTPSTNFCFLCTVLIIGLLGLAEAIPIWGIFPAALLYAVMQCMNYLASRYLNEYAPSDQRATVLSFRGLTTNLAYGGVSLLYSALIAWIKVSEDMVNKTGNNLEDMAFLNSLKWFPGYFIFSVILVLLFFRLRFSTLSEKKN